MAVQASAKLRLASRPIKADRIVATTPMEMNSASLSLVPKAAMAKSLSHGGVKSMMAEPSAKNGEDALLKNAEANWAAANMSAAEQIPATAWNTRTLLLRFCQMPTATHLMCCDPCSPAERRGITTHSVFGTGSGADWNRLQEFLHSHSDWTMMGSVVGAGEPVAGSTVIPKCVMSCIGSETMIMPLASPPVSIPAGTAPSAEISHSS